MQSELRFSSFRLPIDACCLTLAELAQAGKDYWVTKFEMLSSWPSIRAMILASLFSLFIELQKAPYTATDTCSLLLWSNNYSGSTLLSPETRSLTCSQWQEVEVAALLSRASAVTQPRSQKNTTVFRFRDILRRPRLSFALSTKKSV